MFFFTSWVLTVALEALVWYVILKKNAAELVFYSVLINSLTLPLTQYLYLYYLDNLLLMEALVVLAEVPLLYLLLRVTPRQAFYLSFLANLVSALVGLLLISPY
jgi:hypothetical protein